MTPAPSPSRHSIRRHLLLGACIAGLLVAAIGGWAGTTELSGAVIAPGVVVVESNVKKVQHPTGGIVGELRVGDDQRVNEGDVLLRLDETQTRANLAVFTKSLDELYARQARLEAEKDGAEGVQFSEDLLAREATDPEVAHVLAGERKLLSLRLEASNGQKAQLKERIAQLKEQVSGISEQIEAKAEESALIKEELKGVLDLWKKQLIQINRVTSLKRDAARLGGERGQLIAAKAEAGGKTSEIELQILQIDQDIRSKAAQELSEVRAKISELSERKIAAEDQLKHIDIRAPQTGRVHELTVHTVGGVITPGETIMLIVPDNDTLSVQAKVSPNDIDELSPNQPVHLRFSAFNFRTTPELNGKVNWIGADQIEDKQTGTAHYLVRIGVPTSELARLKGLRIIPGMPVEAFIQTESQTALTYLLKPLTDQVMRAFRES
jgi:membrane fusion protein, type I secretion system